MVVSSGVEHDKHSNIVTKFMRGETGTYNIELTRVKFY